MVRFVIIFSQFLLLLIRALLAFILILKDIELEKKRILKYTNAFDKSIEK